MESDCYGQTVSDRTRLSACRRLSPSVNRNDFAAVAVAVVAAATATAGGSVARCTSSAGTPTARTEHLGRTFEAVAHRDLPEGAFVAAVGDGGNAVGRTASAGSSPGPVGRGRRSSGSCRSYATAVRPAGGGGT